MPTAIANVIYTAGGAEWTSPGRLSLAPGSPPAATGPKVRWNGGSANGPVVIPPTILGDWSDSNLPWAYTSTSQFTDTWPVGTTIVDIQTASGDFYTNLSNTVAAAGKRVVVRLQAGVYHLNQFRHIGLNPGDPGYDITYAFGFWFRDLQGFLGQGADKTFIQMDANSMSSGQLSALYTQDNMRSAAFSPLQMGMCRFDGTNPSSPVLIAGVTFRAADQNLLTSVQSDVPVYVPQPAPHQGVVLYYNTYYDIGYTRFQAAGRAMTSAPPFEMANLTSAQSRGLIHNTEFDGRVSGDLNAARPRRCGPLMGNGEADHELEDVWIHHTNVSRYAMNDQSIGTPGVYSAKRVKIEQITNTQNVDPALNNGASLGGYTNASNFGWESSGASITVNDSIIAVTNPNTSGQFPAHFQFTTPSGGTPRNPQGGRLHAKGNTYKNTATSQLDGFCTVRIGTNSYWWQDGPATTLDIRRADNTPLTGYNVTGTWPPSAAQLAAAGVTPVTHYLYKGV